MKSDLHFSLGRLVSVRAGGGEIGRGLLRWEDGYNRYKVGSLWFLASDVASFNEDTRIITLKTQPAGRGCKMAVVSIDTLVQWAKNRRLPPVVYNAPLTDRHYWQWLGDAPMARVRLWAELLKQELSNYSEFPNSSITSQLLENIE